MPERTKPDWTQLVRERLASAERTHDVAPEVVAELAAHLEDDYDEGIESGLDDSAAARHALAGIRWRRLAQTIHLAKLDNSEQEGKPMNPRLKKLWLPALACLMITAVLIVVFEKGHFDPLALRLAHGAMILQLAWFGAMTVSGQTKLEETLMNQRTRSIWLPGFVSLTAAGLFMSAEELVLVHDSSFYFTDLSLRPRYLISGVPGWFYVGWLLAQVLCGALGAFLSRRGGGTRAARVIAGAFPAIVMFAICTIVIPISAIFEHNGFALRHPSALAFGVLIWAAVPALALLLGAAPFLKESTLQPA